MFFSMPCDIVGAFPSSFLRICCVFNISINSKLYYPAHQVWSGSSGELVFNLCKQVQPVYSLAPSPDGE